MGVQTDETLKAVFYIHDRYTAEGTQSRFLFVLIRGDLEVNETKLLNAIGGGGLRPADDQEILAIGGVPGYASPVGLLRDGKELKVQVIVDDVIPGSAKLQV